MKRSWLKLNTGKLEVMLVSKRKDFEELAEMFSLPSIEGAQPLLVKMGGRLRIPFDSLLNSDERVASVSKITYFHLQFTKTFVPSFCTRPQ